jgi:glycyl-tRNA synthetase
MEIEYFIPPDESSRSKVLFSIVDSIFFDLIVFQYFQEWIETYWNWLKTVGLREELLSLQVHPPHKLAHYALACTDILFKFPFGTQELMGIACRGDYDLSQHSSHSGKSLEYLDPNTSTKYLPHIVEPSIGVDRLFLAILVSCYHEELVNGEKRIVLRLPFAIAPIKVSVFPLVGNKPELLSLAKQVVSQLRRTVSADFDVSGAIGRRYRRADEAGVPFCVTIDFESLMDDSATIRFRDSMEQKRVKISEIDLFLREQEKQASYM